MSTLLFSYERGRDIHFVLKSAVRLVQTDAGEWRRDVCIAMYSKHIHHVRLKQCEKSRTFSVIHQILMSTEENKSNHHKRMELISRKSCGLLLQYHTPPTQVMTGLSSAARLLNAHTFYNLQVVHHRMGFFHLLQEAAYCNTHTRLFRRAVCL
jgi:hypothetical protein